MRFWWIERHDIYIPRRDRCLSQLVLRLLSLFSRSSPLSPFLCLPPSRSRDLLLLLLPSLSLSLSRERLLSRRFSTLSLDRERCRRSSRPWYRSRSSRLSLSSGLSRSPRFSRVLPPSLVERGLCSVSVARVEFRSHIAELSVRLARFAGGSAIWLLFVDFGTFEIFDCCGGEGDEVEWPAVGFFDGTSVDGIDLDDTSKLLEGNLSLIDDCDVNAASFFDRGADSVSEEVEASLSEFASGSSKPEGFLLVPRPTANEIFGRCIVRLRLRLRLRTWRYGDQCHCKVQIVDFFRSYDRKGSRLLDQSNAKRICMIDELRKMRRCVDIHVMCDHLCRVHFPFLCTFTSFYHYVGFGSLPTGMPTELHYYIYSLRYITISPFWKGPLCFTLFHLVDKSFYILTGWF